MIFPKTQEDVRGFYRELLGKIEASTPLTPLESQVADILEVHPEYHEALRAVGGDMGPFIHLSLHQALREQISTNQPAGVADVFKHLCHHTDAHDAEHRMMEVLAYQLQDVVNGKAYDEAVYIEALQRLCPTDCSH